MSESRWCPMSMSGKVSEALANGTRPAPRYGDRPTDGCEHTPFPQCIGEGGCIARMLPPSVRVCTISFQ